MIAPRRILPRAGARGERLRGDAQPSSSIYSRPLA